MYIEVGVNDGMRIDQVEGLAVYREKRENVMLKVRTVRSGRSRVVGRMHLCGVMVNLLVVLLSGALLRRRSVVAAARPGGSG